MILPPKISAHESPPRDVVADAPGASDAGFTAGARVRRRKVNWFARPI